MPDLALTVDGTEWSGWTRVEVTRRMEQCATTFRLGLTDRWADWRGHSRPSTGRNARALLPGLACALSWDGIPMLSGWIDQVQIEYGPDRHSLEVSGRDVTGDMVDSAAVVDGAHEWHDLKLDAIVSRICQSFGIPVRPLVDVGAPFPRFAIQPGEEAWTAIERACRARAVLAMGDGAGGLVLTRAGADPSAAVPIVAGSASAAILTASGTWSYADRHSLIVVRGQQESLDGQDDPAASAGPEARVTDPAITRWRPKVVLAEGQGSAVTLATRAAWERQVGAGRARRITYRLAGWTDPGGRLWSPNRAVTVTDPRLDLAGEALLIAGVTLGRDEEGTRSTLELAPADAFAAQPDDDQGEAMWR